MDTMLIKVPVAVNAKVTESFKQRNIVQFEENLKQINMDLQQFEFSAKQAMNQAAGNLQQLPALREQIEAERARITNAKEENEKALAQIKALTLGTEVPMQPMERMVEIKVGDDLESLLQAEIVVEDGKIIAFRG